MSEKRNDVIQIRVSTAEKALIKKYADEAGVRMSEWVREKALAWAGVREIVAEQRDVLNALASEEKPAISPARLRFFRK